MSQAAKSLTNIKSGKRAVVGAPENFNCLKECSPENGPFEIVTDCAVTLRSVPVLR